MKSLLRMWKFNLRGSEVKLLILAILSVAVTACSGGRNSTGYSLINDMMHPVPYEAHSPNPVYLNGQTNQLAVQGTVARGFMPHPLDADGVPVRLENPNPNLTEYQWERGEKLYKATCAACHGIEGAADGLVVERGFPRPPKFQDRRFRYSKKDEYPAGEIYNVITFGRGNMPSHAQQLYPEDRWFVAEYVREKLMTR